MAGVLPGDEQQTQLQIPCDALYRDSVDVGVGQEGIYLGSSKAKQAELGKEELWLTGYGNT